MTVTAVFALLTALFKAIPVLKQAWDELLAMYLTKELENMKAENKAAIRKALGTYDQREIEKLLGADKAGKASGDDGSELRDTLPGVH